MLCKVLVADDSTDISELMRVALERAGYTVDIASCGQEAIRLYRQSIDRADLYALIIVDAAMKDKTGFDVAEEVREGNKRTPILMVTAHTETLIKPHARRIGINHVLYKPFDSDRLLACVRHLTKCEPKAEWIQSSEIG
jgi:DNA-binding response OmpR family regulator